MRRFAAAIAFLLASLSAASAAEADFDFYVLSLSWSPTYCATDPDAERSEQCAGDASHAFVVHGLWPQYERGFPLSCGNPGRLPRRLVDSMLDIMPDRGLVAHEWERHGTCSGLEPEDYFATLREAYALVEVPSELDGPDATRTRSAASIEAAFVEANPGLSTRGVAVDCKDGLLKEVRLCLTMELEFRTCREVDSRGCRSRSVTIPAAE